MEYFGKVMEFLKKYYWGIFFGSLICYSIYLFGYLHLIKGKTIDEVLGPKKDMYAILTEASVNCIKCHGKKEIRGRKEIQTPWGKTTWQGYEATYIDPHKDIKTFKKTSYNLVPLAYAGQYDGLGNHPVGVPYPIYNPEYRNPPIRPILLPNGYVECESCHVVSSPETEGHGALVMSNSESRLCLGCHIK